MAKIAKDITELVGHTPLVKLNRFAEGLGAAIVAKLEFFNPGSSIKDRIGLAMIEAEEKQRKISTIVEPTSGNTGIALAWIGAIKGYKVILTMPEIMSIERQKLLKFLGAEVVLTPGSKGMQGAIDKALELAKGLKDSFVPMQFKNKANPEVHRTTTAEEIWQDTDGEIDILVAGIGTGGTITGVGEALKKKKNSIQIIGVEPEKFPHKIQGIGAGFVPEVLNQAVIDEIIKISDEEAFENAGKIAQKDGIMVGISSGAALAAAKIMAARPENKGKLIVVILPDTAERYISTLLFPKREGN